LSDQAVFESRLAKEFAAIDQAITDDERGLLHLEMAVVARATSSAIDTHSDEEVDALISWIDDLFSDASPDLENAIYVSYLENVFLGRSTEPYLAARARLSPRLKEALVELELHWREIDNWLRNRYLPPSASGRVIAVLSDVLRASLR